MADLERSERKIEISEHYVNTLAENMDPRHRLFVYEYLSSYRKGRAGQAAGYSPSRASREANEMLKREDVRELMNAVLILRQQQSGITAERVVKEMAEIGFTRAGDFVNYDPDHGITFKSMDELKRLGLDKAVKKIKITTLKSKGSDDYSLVTELEFYDKLKALELLGKHTAIFTDNANPEAATQHNVTNVVNNTIVINHRKPGDELQK